MSDLIRYLKSIVPAADVGINELPELVSAMVGIRGIGGIKLGFMLMPHLKEAVEIVKLNLGPEFTIIYDHQKAGTDVPDTGPGFAKTLAYAGVDAAILFPLSGPATQRAYTNACMDIGLTVMTGGMMTHPEFLVSEGGYIDNNAPEKIYRLACQLGCTDFIVPGNKLPMVEKIIEWLNSELGKGKYACYGPGFVTQGGNLSDCCGVVGSRFHGIVGRAVTGPKGVEAKRAALMELTSQLGIAA